MYRQLWAFQILTKQEKTSGIQAVLEIQPPHISILASSDNLPREQYITNSYNTIIMEKAKPQIRSSKECEMASS